MDKDDLYERHALQYLLRHQQVSESMRMSLSNIEYGRIELRKYWPQILAAFGWALAHQSTSKVAVEFCRRFFAGRLVSGNFILNSSLTDLSFIESADRWHRR